MKPRNRVHWYYCWDETEAIREEVCLALPLISSNAEEDIGLLSPLKKKVANYYKILFWTNQKDPNNTLIDPEITHSINEALINKKISLFKNVNGHKYKNIP